MTLAGVLPARRGCGNQFRCGNGSPCCFVHVSMNIRWSCATTGPSSRTFVSRHPGALESADGFEPSFERVGARAPLEPLPGAEPWEYTPLMLMPPVYPTCPSTITTLRWLRLFTR